MIFYNRAGEEDMVELVWVLFDDVYWWQDIVLGQVEESFISPKFMPTVLFACIWEAQNC